MTTEPNQVAGVLCELCNPPAHDCICPLDPEDCIKLQKALTKLGGIWNVRIDNVLLPKMKQLVDGKCGSVAKILHEIKNELKAGFPMKQED